MQSAAPAAKSSAQTQKAPHSATQQNHSRQMARDRGAAAAPPPILFTSAGTRSKRPNSAGGHQSRTTSSSPGRSCPQDKGQAWPASATEDELARAADALQSAEALQAKLAAMPDHLRAPILQQCPG